MVIQVAGADAQLGRNGGGGHWARQNRLNRSSVTSRMRSAPCGVALFLAMVRALSRLEWMRLMPTTLNDSPFAAMQHSSQQCLGFPASVGLAGAGLARRASDPHAVGLPSVGGWLAGAGCSLFGGCGGVGLPAVLPAAWRHARRGLALLANSCGQRVNAFVQRLQVACGGMPSGPGALATRSSKMVSSLSHWPGSTRGHLCGCAGHALGGFGDFPLPRSGSCAACSRLP